MKIIEKNIRPYFEFEKKNAELPPWGKSVLPPCKSDLPLKSKIESSFSENHYYIRNQHIF